MQARTPEELLREMTWLRRLARSLVADQATADDLAGDTLAVWLANRTPLRNVRAWLRKVLRHRADRHRRREQLRERGEGAAARSEPLPAVDEALHTAQLHRAVADAVLALAEPSRSAVVLRYLEDLPLHEVARRLRVPAETARTRIKRGIEQLRARLDERYGNRASWAALLTAHPALPALPSLTLLMGTKSLLAASAIAIAAVLSLWLTRDPTPPPAVLSQAASVPAGSPVADAPREQDTTPAMRHSAEPVGRGARPTAAVTGRVLDEATRLPLREVDVSWLALDSATPRSQPGVRTGADGRFELTTLVAAPQDHCVVLLRQQERALLTVDLGTPEGQAPLRFDVGDVLMPPGTAVSGTVFDAAGDKAPATPLFVCLFSFWTNEGRIVRLEQARLVGRSTDDGTFVLDDRLLPNRPPPILIAAGERGVGFVDLADLRRDRGEATADVHLLAPSPLRVHVTDERGEPVAGALVVTEPRFLPICMPGTFPIRVENVPELADSFCRRTDAGGRAELQPVALRGASSTPYTLRVEASGRDSSLVRVQVPHAGDLEIVLPTQRLLEVHGTVRHDGGRPVAGATVKARWRANAAAQTRDDGSYSLALARGEGPLWLEVAARGAFPARQQSQPDAAATSVEVDFTLQPAIELLGNIVDEDNRPVAGANVWISGDDGQSTPSDRDGRFRMPVPPASARVLSVQPPEPSSAWLGHVEHLLLPGQSTVTLVLTRHARGRARLDVELLDPQGKLLEPRDVTLAREDGPTTEHPATGTIGRITADGLTPGEWTLRVEPTNGCELLARFRVQPDEDVSLRLQQPMPASARGDVVFDVPPGQQPERVDVFFTAGGQRARFLDEKGQPLPQGRRLRLRTADGLGFSLADADPTRVLSISAEAGDYAGEAHVHFDRSAEARVRIVVRALARVHLRSAAPLLADNLMLQFRRRGEAWGESLHFRGLAGRTDLIDWKLPAGEWEWRLRLPTRGDDNRTASPWHDGRFEVAAGAGARIDVPDR
ncbi:MAG TPA: sigma-70 family RNA polymerase sigma factor [Planctomycetota bacterium]